MTIEKPTKMPDFRARLVTNISHEERLKMAEKAQTIKSEAFDAPVWRSGDASEPVQQENVSDKAVKPPVAATRQNAAVVIPAASKATKKGQTESFASTGVRFRLSDEEFSELKAIADRNFSTVGRIARVVLSQWLAEQREQGKA